MKNKLSFTLAIIFCLSFFTLTVQAVSPTPEASPTVAEEVKEIRETVKEKVREKLDEVKKGQKRAFVGEILKITNSTLVLDTRRGEKQTQVAKDAAILSLGKKIEFEDLEIGSFAMAMGYLDEDGTLQSQRVVVTTKPKKPARQVAFGKVTDISQQDIITVNNEKKGIIYTIEVTSETKITKKVEDKIQKVEVDEIEEGNVLVAIGTPEENEEKIITAKIIHVIPGLTKKQPTPTPEAELEKEPSPTPEE